LGIIIGAVVFLFIIRLFYVLGQMKTNSRKTSSDGIEIYSICKSKGMNVHDIHSIENDPRAVTWVKERLSYIKASGQNVGRSRNDLIASCVYDAWRRKEKFHIASVVTNWGRKHGLPQFTNLSNNLTKDEPFSITDDEIDSVYDLKILSAEVGWFGTGDPITSIPDEVFMLPKLECLHFGEGGNFETFAVELDGIPDSIKNAKNLKFLHLQHCGLKEIPQYIFTPWLEELKLGGNGIKTIPDGIEAAKSLRMLTIWMNDLEYVPESIGDLINLKRLDLTYNPRLKLPNSIINLGDMEEMYIDEDLPGLTQEQLAWMKKNNSFIRQPEENEELPI
jgi:hypothetical protein